MHRQTNHYLINFECLLSRHALRSFDSENVGFLFAGRCLYYKVSINIRKHLWKLCLFAYSSVMTTRANIICTGGRVLCLSVVPQLSTTHIYGMTSSIKLIGACLCQTSVASIHSCLVKWLSQAFSWVAAEAVDRPNSVH